MQQFIKSAMGLALVLGAQASMAADATPRDCTLDWAKMGATTGPSQAWGLGISTNTDPTQAREEAKSKAYGEIGLQLRSSVQSSANLTETDKSTAFSSLTSIENKMDSLNGMKIIKEGSDPTAHITACVAARFDVRSAYEIPAGKMQGLQAQLQTVSQALKDKKYLDVLRLAKNAKKAVADAKDDIALADTYRVFLQEVGGSWNGKFTTLLAQVSDAEAKARENVVFVLPDGAFAEAFVDVESDLAGQGFSVVNKTTDVEPGKYGVSIDTKTVGTPRKTKTALGVTVTQKISVIMRDLSTKKDLASNHGAEVVGTGASDEDASANVMRQLSTHITKVINNGLPGLLTAEE